MLELGFEPGPQEARNTFGGADAASTATLTDRAVAFARYRLVGLIGEGGMGSVYEAEQDHPSRTVALKIIKPGISSPKLLRRFEQESQALGRLQHPGIAHIYEAGTADMGFGPQPYFAMELIRGRTLTDYATASLPKGRARLEIVARIAEAVHHAHQRGLIHRDLKPGNILVDESGQPKILDFGVARVTDGDTQATSQTDVGQLVGTLAYMSPEQVLGDPLEIDIRSDVYSLGVILYELLAGTLPYATGRLPETIRAIREEEPARLGTLNRSYRGDVETIATTALEKDKSRRYGSAGELAADIRRCLRDEPIVARAPSLPYQLRKFVRRNRALVAGMTAAFVVVAAGIVVAALAVRLGRAERDRADTRRRLATLMDAEARLQTRVVDAQQLVDLLQLQKDVGNRRTATAEQDGEVARRRVSDLQAEIARAQHVVTARDAALAQQHHLAAEAITAERNRADAIEREKTEALRQLERARYAKILQWLNNPQSQGVGVRYTLQLLTPSADQQIPQEDPAATCAASRPTPRDSLAAGVPGTAPGTPLRFDWMDVPRATHYRLIAGNLGAMIPLVKEQVSESEYTRVSCGFVTDDNLRGWFWVVQAFVDGAWAVSSAPRTFEFLPCRRADGQHCSRPR